MIIILSRKHSQYPAQTMKADQLPDYIVATSRHKSPVIIREGETCLFLSKSTVSDLITFRDTSSLGDDYDVENKDTVLSFQQIDENAVLFPK